LIDFIKNFLYNIIRKNKRRDDEMKTIYKYPLKRRNPSDNLIKINMPKNADLVNCGLDMNYNICLWAYIDSEEEEEEERKFYILGTGWAIPENKIFIYIGMVNDNGYIWHILEDAGSEV
jgi:hypothetical protein